MAVNLDPIVLEKRLTDGKSWPNVFVEKLNRGEDLKVEVDRFTGVAPWGKKAPLKISKKGKIKKYDVFSGIKVRPLLKLAFLLSLTRKYMLWEGFDHNFSTKKASASRGLCPLTPTRGSAPWTPEFLSPPPPPTIYPGAAPVGSMPFDECIGL